MGNFSDEGKITDQDNLFIQDTRKTRRELFKVPQISSNTVFPINTLTPGMTFKRIKFSKKYQL